MWSFFVYKGYFFSADILCDMGMIEQLIGLLNEEHSGFHEHLMSALLTIVKDHSRSLRECLRPEFDLITVLQTRKTELHGKEQFRVSEQGELLHVNPFPNVIF